MNPYYTHTRTPRKRSSIGLVIGVIVALLVLAIMVVIIMRTRGAGGAGGAGGNGEYVYDSRWGSGCGTGCQWVQLGTTDRQRLFDSVYEPDNINYGGMTMPKNLWEEKGKPGVWVRRSDQSDNDGRRARKMTDWVNATYAGQYPEGTVLGYKATYPYAEAAGIL